jgi:ADP-heptose:LPS heptosyltransferase
MIPPATKPRLLVIELWGLGDLVIATPFLRAAAEKYDVTVLAKPYATDLQERLWPGVRVLPFIAPWTAFRRKYRLGSWPWREMFHLRHVIRAARFDVGLSARWDPRDHFLLTSAGAKKRLGFPRVGSRIFLTQPLNRADPGSHRYENWRILGQAIGLELPSRENIPIPVRSGRGTREILVHTGAGQPVRVWPLERYRGIVERLRKSGYRVQVACDPDQRDWWLRAGEEKVATPHTVTELLALLDRAAGFIGNDSGPGHLAAFSGVPTFTIFGPQLPEWFAPLHPRAEWAEGKACPYKPCSDYCRFAAPLCMDRISEEEIWVRLESFAARSLSASA